MNPWIVAASILLSLVAAARADASAIVVIAGAGDRSVAAVVREEAESIAAQITIDSAEEDPRARAAGLREARAILEKSVERESGVAVRRTGVSLSGRRASAKFASSSRDYTGSSRVHLTLTSELGGADVLERAAALEALVSALEAPRGVTYQLGQVRLATSDPETRRVALLEAIAAEISRTRGVLGDAGRVTVSGLDGPVLVRQVSDREVELFIDYSLSIELDAGS